MKITKNHVKDIKVFLNKKKKQQYRLERCKNLSEYEIQRLVGYRNKIIKLEKTPLELQETIFFWKF